MWVDFDDEETIRIASRREQLGPRRTVVQGQVDVAGSIEGSALDDHDARGESAENRCELPETTWHVLDPVALRKEDAFGRPEEAAAIRDTRFGEYVVVVEEEGPTEHEIHPVIPGTQSGQKCIRIRRTQSETDLITGADVGNRLLRSADGRHNPFLLPDGTSSHERGSPGGAEGGLKRSFVT